MLKIIKGKMLALLILIMFVILLNLYKNNQSYKRFILVDMEQSTQKVNEYFYDIMATINRILINDGEIQVGYDEINNLMAMHMTISREIFNLKMKYGKLGGEFRESFQGLHDNFTRNKYDIAEYYDKLNKKLDKSTYIILEDDDISKLKSILSFYIDTKREFNELMR